MSNALAALICGFLAFLVALALAARSAALVLRRRIVEEKARGHLRLRRRARNLVGRKRDEYGGVFRAETMPGWVWISYTRRPREPFHEQIGWAPLRCLARRQLSHYRRATAPGRRART